MPPWSATTPRALQLRRLLGALIGTSAGWSLARALPLVPSTLLTALVMAGGMAAHRQLRDAGRWWALVGVASGTVLGTACVLATALQRTGPEDQWPQRATTVLTVALAGLVAGRFLRPELGDDWSAGRQPRDLVRSASSLTTGVFAALVTTTFVHSGLDAARTFSSRLSTSLTILVISLAGPAWISHLLGRGQSSFDQNSFSQNSCGQRSHPPGSPGQNRDVVSQAQLPPQER